MPPRRTLPKTRKRNTRAKYSARASSMRCSIAPRVAARADPGLPGLCRLSCGGVASCHCACDRDLAHRLRAGSAGCRTGIGSLFAATARRPHLGVADQPRGAARPAANRRRSSTHATRGPRAPALGASCHSRWRAIRWWRRQRPLLKRPVTGLQDDKEKARGPHDHRAFTLRRLPISRELSRAQARS